MPLLISLLRFVNSVHRLLRDLIELSIKCLFSFTFCDLEKSDFTKVLLVSSIISLPIMDRSTINLYGSFFSLSISSIFVYTATSAFNELAGYSFNYPFKDFLQPSSSKGFRQLTLHLICISGALKSNRDTCHLPSYQRLLFFKL